MSNRSSGSSAGTSRRRPPSAAARRRVIRRVLTEHQPVLAMLVAQIGNSNSGPDPEAALPYLKDLLDVAGEAWARLHK